VCVSGAGVCVSGACAYVRDAHVHLRLTDKFSRTSQVVHTQTNTLTPTNTHTRTWLPDISQGDSPTQLCPSPSRGLQEN